jgi:hypothetical protein
MVKFKLNLIFRRRGRGAVRRAGRGLAWFGAGCLLFCGLSTRTSHVWQHKVVGHIDIRDGKAPVYGYRWLARFRSPACFALERIDLIRRRDDVGRRDLKANVR